MIDKTAEILKRCEDGTYCIGEYKGLKHKLLLSCINGHTREITPEKLLSRGDKIHCKICNNTHGLSKTHEVFAKECLNYNLILLDKYSNNHTPVLVRNNTCNHEYLITPNSLTSKGVGEVCRICTPVINTSKQRVFTNLLSKDLEIIGTYKGTTYPHLVRNIKCNHEYIVDLHSVLYKNTGYTCKKCVPIVNLKPIEEITSILDYKNLELVGEYTGTKEDILIRHKDCGHSYNILATNILYTNQGSKCKVCYPFISTEELEILTFIKTIYSGWIISGDRTIISPMELDIVLPDLGIAFEYNGNWWHRESNTRDKNYHLNKLIGVENFGYTLISITEEEWLNKKDIVKSRIKSLIGVSTKVYARKTTVKQIPFPALFLNTNHLQGAGNISSINYGLFLEEDLIAVMTFGTPRFNTQYDYELIRYCSKLGVNVIGGASKLLKKFRDNNKGSLISYSNKRWSSGKLYNTLGFTHSHDSAPGYVYIKGSTILSRYKCQKHLLKGLFPDIYKEELTETEIMSIAGYYRVFDCGNGVWTLK